MQIVVFSLQTTVLAVNFNELRLYILPVLLTPPNRFYNRNNVQSKNHIKIHVRNTSNDNFT